MVPDLLAAENIVLLTGDFGTGKSYISYFLADAISTGGEFVERQCQQHPVLILDRENPHSTVYLRRGKVGNLKERDNVRILSLFTEVPAPDFNDAQLLELCARIKPVIIVDSLAEFHPGKKEVDPDDMTQVFQSVRGLITAGAVAVVILHHVPKSGGSYRGTTAIPAAVDGAIEVSKSKGVVTLKGFKARDSEERVIELKIKFGSTAVTYEVLDPGLDSEEQFQETIRAYVMEHDGCSIKDVAKGIHKREESVRDGVSAMLRIGKLYNIGDKPSDINKGGRGNSVKLSVKPPVAKAS